MKSKAQKQKDLTALAEQFKQANAAMLVSFKKMTVAKDQELRRQLREAGVSYEVVKNTLARKAAAGTALEPMVDQFKGVTAVALSTNDPVAMSKAISKFAKANAEIFTFKVGLVEGKVVELKEVESIASLPSREELISKVLFLINAQAQRLVTVIQAVPRNLAVVMDQVRAQKEAQGAYQIRTSKFILRPSCFCQWAALEDGERGGDANRTAADENGKQKFARTNAGEC